MSIDSRRCRSYTAGVLIAVAIIALSTVTAFAETISYLESSGDRPELVLQFGHSGDVWDVKFSPDGRTLATAGWDSVKLWDVATGDLKRTFAAPTHRVSVVAFSSDGNALAAAGMESNTITLWNVRTGSTQRTLRGRVAEIYHLDFAPDGRLISAGEQKHNPSDDRLVLELWDVSKAKAKTMFVGLEFPIFMPDGRTMAIEVLDDKARFLGWYLMDIATGKTLGRLPRLGTYSADGQTVAVSKGEGVTWLWDLRTGLVLSVLRGYAGDIGAKSFSPDGKVLVIGSSRGSLDKHGEVTAWDVRTGLEY